MRAAVASSSSVRNQAFGYELMGRVFVDEQVRLFRQPEGQVVVSADEDEDGLSCGRVA